MTDPANRLASEPLSDQIAQILTALLHVVQSDVQFARAEVLAGLRGMVRGAVLMMLAGLLTVVALTVLANAAVAAFVAIGLAPGLAGLAVAMLLMCLMYIAFHGATALLNPRNLLPLRSLSRLRDDFETLKELVIRDDENDLNHERSA